jgi:hypothetical protein
LHDYCEHQWALPPIHCEIRNDWRRWPRRICRIHTAKFEFGRDGVVFHAAFPIPVATGPADDAFGAHLAKR